MTNYIPARLSHVWEDPATIGDDHSDYNPEIDRMIEDRLFESEFENEIHNREEGEGWL